MGGSTSTADDFTRPADTMRERIGDGRIKFWFLMTGNRWAVTAVISVLSYVLLLIFDLFGGGSIQKLVTTSAVTTAFSSVLIAIVTAVSLVLSISQIVLSQEIGSLGSQRERMQTATEFRKDVEETGGVGTSPSEPARFLKLLVEMVEVRANWLRESVIGGSRSDEGEGIDEMDEIVAYADGIVDHSEKISDQLEGAEFGSFRTLLPVLDYNYSWKIAAARNLRDRHADALPGTADDALDELIEALRFFGPAREHFKTLYFQWEIANLSRAMLYTAMPTLMIAGFVMFTFEATDASGTVIGFSPAFLAVGALFVISLLPFAILLAYLLRILTVAQRTLAIGPFILRETEEVESVRASEDPE